MSSSSPLARLFRYARPYKARLGWAVVAMALYAAGSAGLAALIKTIFDDVLQDRSQLGYVIDYADFHIGEFRPFLIFNVADAAITIGVLIILARALFMREKPPAPQGENHAPQAELPADQSAENS